MRVEVKPELLRWARERAGFDLAALVKRFPQLPDWESGGARPTLKQLEKFAKATYAPLGFLFLPEPPSMCRFRTSAPSAVGTSNGRVPVCSIRCTSASSARS